MKTLAPLLTIILCLSASLASADPRWWWDDRPVAPAREDRQWPHIAGGGGQGGAGEGGGLFLVFSEWDPVDGDWEVYLTTTPNLGCQWCDPVRLTDNAIDDTRPRVGSAILPDGSFSIQVVFEQAGNVVVAYDTSISAWDPPQQLCANLAALGPNVITNGQYRTLNSMPGTASFPDISVGSLFGGFNHFHATWQDARLPGESDIYVARDTTGLGGLSWSAESLVTPGSPPSVLSERPTISADIFTQTAGESAVNLAFLDSLAGEVRYLRSVDSGSSWSAVGAPSGSLSDPPGSPAGRLAFDTGRNPWSVDTPVWHCAAWEDHAGVDPVLQADSQFNDNALTALPAWDTDELVRSSAAPGVANPSLVVLAQNPEDSPVLLFWTDPAEGQDEIFYRGGRLSTTAPDSMDFSAMAFFSQRPLDPAVSSDVLLTSCDVDDTTLNCLSTRTLGDASQSSAEGDFMATYVVWRDTRDGVGNIYFKRSDDNTWGNAPTLSTRCSDLVTAEVTVQWLPAQTCDNSFWGNEQLRRYLVYYGTDPAGPYDNAASPIEVAYDPLAASHEVTIGSLTPGTTYHVIVVPEDEARNVSPPSFDPTVDNGALFSEVSVDTPALCEPAFTVACTILSDRCPSNAALDDDGQADFAEFIDMEIEVTNSGTMAATDYSADLSGGIGTIVLPASASFSIPSIGVGQTVLLPLTIQLPPSSAAACGDPVDLDLVNQTSDSGLFLYPDDELASCDLSLGDPTPPCSECAPAALVVVESVSLAADSCLSDLSGPGSGNGALDPDERVSVELTFRNIGGLPATGFMATASVPGGGTLVTGGAIGPVDVAAGGVYVHALELDVSAGCGDLVDVDVTGLSSDGGTRSYADELVAADQRVGSGLSESITAHVDSEFVWIPDGGGPVQGFLGVTTSEGPVVDSAMLRVTNASFQDPDDTVLTLIGPLGTLDVTAAILGDVDLTSDYNGALGGAGNYLLQAEDTSADGSPDSWIGNWELEITDWDATCDPCVAAACTALSFIGGTSAVANGDCSIEVSWRTATGEGPVSYELLRDGLLLASGLAGPPYTDTAVLFGASHSYQVEAVDSCASPAPQRALNTVSPPVAVTDATGPSVGSPSLSYAGAGPGDCAVTLDGTVTADCAPLVDLSILRDTFDPPTTVVASGVSLPFADAAPGDGTYYYRIRSEDAAGNVTETASLPVNVDACLSLCLFRSVVADTASLDPAAVYLTPRLANGIGLQGSALRCAIATGEVDLGAVDGSDLMLYQIDEPTAVLTVSRQGSDIRIDF